MSKRNLYFLVLLTILILAMSLPLISLYSSFENQRLENRKAYLDQGLIRTTLEFEKGIKEYAVFVSGLRSHIIEMGQVPTAAEVQSYFRHQLEFIDYGHSVIINYLDKNHRFIYSVSDESLTPNELAGVELAEIRDTNLIKRLDGLFQNEKIMAFPLINMVEGFVGFPINFAVMENGEVKGYIASIINIKNILDPIYTYDVNNDFRYRFSFGSGIEFDREYVDDGSMIHHNRVDSLRPVSNLDNFVYIDLESLKQNYKIGIDYNEQDHVLSIAKYIRTSAIVILAFIILSAILIYLFLQNYNRAKDLKISNENLYAMNSLLRKFIFAASHDLKQPVVNINNFNGLIKNKFSDILGEKGNKYLDVITQNVDYMNNMLDDLLVYSKVIRRNKNKEKVEVHKVLDKIKESYPEEKILINYNFLSTVYGFETEIYRLFQNLISNAIKYNENEIIEINVNAETKNGYIEFIVSDNGIGIAEEHLKRIFDEFQRLDKKKYKGTGLGLSICKEIVANHGGTLFARRNVKEGTDFIFQLSAYV